MKREERDKAIKILQWLHDNNFLFRSTEEDVKYATELAIQALEQEPRKGHWIKGHTFPDGAYWKCDKCNELIKVKFPMNYCNNCGAYMREVEE